MKPFKQAFRAIFLPALCTLFHGSLSAQSNKPVSKEEQRTILDKTFSLLEENYIFPEKLKPIQKEVYNKLSKGVYSTYTALDDFLKVVNTDLETLSNDKHIHIFFDPVRVKQINAASNQSQENSGYAPEFLQRAKYENYMVRKLERMDGNVGYLKFNAFVDTALAKNTLIATMTVLANSSALIIDLRQNGGGDASTLVFLLSYFLNDSTLISQVRSRKTIPTKNQFTVDEKGVQKFGKDIPVFILISQRTASAAEAFAYTLQAYKRATVIGEVTKGEANPGYLFSINQDLYLMVPTFENINPVTKTNWQGKGVSPDISIPADKALLMAQMKAYDTLAQLISVPELKSMYEWMAVGLQGELRPFTVPESNLKMVAGEFADNRHIQFLNGALYYYRGDDSSTRKKLIPLKADVFGLDGVPFFRVRFLRNENAEVTALEGLYDYGQKEVSKKLSK